MPNMEYHGLLCCSFYLVLIACYSIHMAEATEWNHSSTQPIDDWNNPFGKAEYLIDHSCHIRATDPFLHKKILQLLVNKVKLINYKLDFVNYTTNPLLVNTTWSYKADRWARVSSQHGQTLLSLAFNYGILSMMTLTFGVESLDVTLEDSPNGCVVDLNERQKNEVIMSLLMADFKEADMSGVTGAAPLDQVVTLLGDERVCHEMVLNVSGFAKFTDRCCHVDQVTGEKICTTDLTNTWLIILHWLLAGIKFSMMFFGPLLFIPMIEVIAKENIPYAVELKEALKKKIILVQGDTPVTYTHDKMLDLRRVKGFPKFKKAVDELPLGEPFLINISQFDILVGYEKLMSENKVPVGMLQCMARGIFQCRLKDTGPFRDCCTTDVMRSCQSDYEITWLHICQAVSKALLLLLLPLPYYIRLVVFYLYEYPEVKEREQAISQHDLQTPYDGNLLHYLSPTHPLFLSMYCLYFFTATSLAFIARPSGKGKFKKIILGSFQDLKHLSWINALGMVISNVIWPFRRFGLMGCVVCLLYWPIAIPISLVICVFYCLPSIYITFRMLIHSRKSLTKNIFKRRSLDDDGDDDDSSLQSGKYAVRRQIDRSIGMFETGRLFGHISPSNDLHQDGFQQHVPGMVKVWRIIEHFFVATLCIVTMFAILVILSECVGFAVEVIVFTMMGVIVNAGSVLKYSTLLFLIFLYGYDAYNHVEKKYIKLNKSLFAEVKGRIKDMEEVTSLPSYLQENRGFKTQELSEQAAYEQPDDVSDFPQNWLINDLVLFIDNEDRPRIPRQLFEDVCNIRVAGAPGPVYLSLLEATKTLLLIIGFLLFVFLVVLSFGEVYRVSTPNQMFAILAGGFLPLILKHFIQANKPDIELSTVSFKSKLDEIIKNFFQNWPMYDFPFQVVKNVGSGTFDKKDSDGKSGTATHEIGTQTFEDPDLNPNNSPGKTDQVVKISEEQTANTNAEIGQARDRPKPTQSIASSRRSSITYSQSGSIRKVPPNKPTSLPLKSSMHTRRSSSVPESQARSNSVAFIQQNSMPNMKPQSGSGRRQTSPSIPNHGINTVVNVPIGKAGPGRRPSVLPDGTPNHGITTIKNTKISIPESVAETESEASSQFVSSRRFAPGASGSVTSSKGRTVSTLANIPEGYPRRKPSSANPGITTTKAPAFILNPNAPESVARTDESAVSPSISRRMTTSTPTSTRKTSPLAVENIPMLDPNQNIHNFLNSASDFTVWQDPKPSSLRAGDVERKETVVSEATLKEAVDRDVHVDLVVVLPEHPDNDLWLKEWSDMDAYEEPPELDRSLTITEDDMEMG